MHLHLFRGSWSRTNSSPPGSLKSGYYRSGARTRLRRQGSSWVKSKNDPLILPRLRKIHFECDRVRHWLLLFILDCRLYFPLRRNTYREWEWVFDAPIYVIDIKNIFPIVNIYQHELGSQIKAHEVKLVRPGSMTRKMPKSSLIATNMTNDVACRYNVNSSYRGIIWPSPGCHCG